MGWRWKNEYMNYLSTKLHLNLARSQFLAGKEVVFI